VTEVIKEMLKPVWKSGKLTREVRRTSTLASTSKVAVETKAADVFGHACVTWCSPCISCLVCCQCLLGAVVSSRAAQAEAVRCACLFYCCALEDVAFGSRCAH
jgi:hypothetical protein